MDEQELKDRLVEQTNLWYALACEYYKITYKPIPVEFDVKGSVAGWAMGNGKIKYNLNLAKTNTEEFFKRTVPHEVAHIVCHKNFPNERGHGKFWKMVMTTFQVEPKRCHSYDTSGTNTGVKKFSYKCSKCGNVLTVGKNIHTKLQKGEKRWHKGCNGFSLIYIPD